MNPKITSDSSSQWDEWIPTDTLLVKVGDLLHKQGAKDVIAISNLRIDDAISDITWSVELVGISDDELYAVAKDLSYCLHIPCDYCGESKMFTKTLGSETYTFILERSITPEMKEEETIFPISIDMTIDLYPVIREMIGLANDVQHACEDCQKRLETLDDNQVQTDNPLGWNIIFT